LEVFCDTWAAHINDLSRLSKEIDAAASGRVAAEKQAYMSLPRPGVGSSSSDTSSLSERVQMLSVGDFVSSVNVCDFNNIAKQHTTSDSCTSSAFVPYKRQNYSDTSTVYFNREQPNDPVILRQSTKEAPLAKFDDDLLVEKKANQFENRMSLILDSLNKESKDLNGANKK
jgi:hypothetical protein